MQVWWLWLLVATRTAMHAVFRRPLRLLLLLWAPQLPETHGHPSAITAVAPTSGRLGLMSSLPLTGMTTTAGLSAAPQWPALMSLVQQRWCWMRTHPRRP